MRALLLIVVVVSMARAVRAESVGVVVTGEPTKQAAVAAQIRSWLDRNGYVVVTSPLDKDGQKTVLDCFVLEDVGCARAAFEKRSRAPSLVFARIELSGDRGLALTTYLLVRGHDVVAEKRWCKHCDEAVLAQTIDQLLTVLLRSTNEGKIEIHSRPEGAAIVLDGVAVGAAPVARDVSIGLHKIELKRDGATVASKTVTIDRGATASITLGVGEDAPRGKSHLLPALLIGAGGAAIIASGVFLYYGHKGGPDAPLVYPYATGEGVAFGVVGIAAIVGGAVLWRRDAHASGPTAMLGPRGATIGWAGSF